MSVLAGEMPAILELIGVATLCTWTVSLSVGLGLCAPDRAVLMGVPGTLLGGLLFELLHWPAGPALAGYPVVPALVGTTLIIAVTAYATRLRDELQERRAAEERRRPVRDWPTAPHQAPPHP
jgi:uncharacterized membrane protein YeaQ/YmgE (transglycosylase-associated protein family)